MDGQTDIFSFLDHNPIENQCCVVMDGICQNITWQELFDNKIFDTLRCVTYVSSGAFYERAAGQFDKVQIIIGIEKSDVKRAFAESIRARLQGEGNKVFSALSEKTKKRIINRELILRYSTADTIIHSKFYLLSNSKTGASRVIVGSANLTGAAFENRVSQYEDVLVFNESEYFKIYEQRFETLFTKTEDYVTEDTIKNYREGTLVPIIVFTAEEKTEALLETLRKGNIVPLINEGVLQAEQEIQSEDEKEQVEIRAAFEVIAATSKKSRKTGGYVIKSPQELETVKTKIVDILYRGTKKEQELARFTLNFNDADKKLYRIFVSDDGNQSSRSAEIYDRKATPEEITTAVQNLNQFIAAYHDFVSSPDPDNANLAHVLETIMYAFAAAYIFKLRQETTSSRKTDIPIMLIIGGRAASGKSSLLAYIDALLSGRHMSREDHYFQYEKLSKGRTLEDLFTSENTYPLLVDEVAPGFFNSKSAGRGEALIKYLANTLDGKHPVMICTTNTDTFNIPAQVARRIYYLQVDACFDEKKKGQATAYYEKVLAEADNILFRDYCYRIGEIIAHQENLFGNEDNCDFDYLSLTREVFKSYYQETGISVPSYMPKGLYRDYANRGREMWKVLFEQNKSLFSYRENEKTNKPELVVNLKEIAVATKDVNVYMNYLRQDLLIEAAGLYTILRAELFFEWIDVVNPWRKQSFFKKLFGKN